MSFRAGWKGRSDMRIRINPSKPSGSLVARPSKSSMQRAVAAAMLAKGQSILSNACYSEDSISALKMAECLGANIDREVDIVRVRGGFNPSCEELHCGESGLGVRLFSAIAALSGKQIRITGRGSILGRSMSMIEEALVSLGVEVQSNKGFLPIDIKGPLKGGEIKIDGSATSQFLSGLLFALPLCKKDSIIKVDSLKSKPYIDLSISVLEAFGIEIINRDYSEFIIKGRQNYRPARYRIEEDWSGIAFLAVLGAIAGKVIINDISFSSVQSDKAIIEILETVGAGVVRGENSIELSNIELKAFEFDINDCPDLAPPLAALAAFCKGKSILRGTKRLEGKESNRAYTLKSELGKLGVDIALAKDRMEISGSGSFRAAEVDSHGDHRIAMALAVCATGAEGPVIINGAEAVSKSYPGFFDDIASLGISVEEI
jgi:3-phosphoshikimate 1-carboxyvinyltransferase